MTAMQSEMFNLVNAARAENGVAALSFNGNLSTVAQVKAQEMVDSNYFSHTSPAYGSPFDMMTNFGIVYSAAGENLAGDSSVANAHNALIASQGHKDNILQSSFTSMGIGIVDSPTYGYIFVQMFIG
jgi:uncharacterized YkwD family protein